MPLDLSHIARLVNQALQPKGIQSKVLLKGETLQIFLRSDQPINREAVTQYLSNGIQKLNPDGIGSLSIYAKLSGQTDLNWVSQVEIKNLSQTQASALKPQTLSQPTVQSPSTRGAKRKPNSNQAWLGLGTILTFLISLPTVVLFIASVGTATVVFIKLKKKGETDNNILGTTWCKYFIGSFWSLFALSAVGLALLPKSPKPQVTDTAKIQLATTDTSKGKTILTDIEQATGYKPTIDTWGNGKGLFLAKLGWDKLSPSDRNAVIQYAQANGAQAIVVGKVIEKQPKNSLTLDETVWQENVTSSASPDPLPNRISECKSAAGNMWSGVKVYLDSNCEKPFAVILGGTEISGERGVVLKFDTGETEVKKRSAVAEQAYVMANDPAMGRREWLQY